MTAASGRVLVLNRGWMPINVTSATNAIHMVWNCRATFVDVKTYAQYDFENWVLSFDDAIRTAKIAADQVIPICGFNVLKPEVVVCSEYRGFGFKVDHSRRPKFSRRNLFLRDRNTCQFCGKKFPTDELTLDHVIPKSKGGLTCWTNIVLACSPCNLQKADKTPSEAGLVLRRKPFEPTGEQLTLSPADRIKFKIGRAMPKTWEGFLGEMYWGCQLDSD